MVMVALGVLAFDIVGAGRAGILDTKDHVPVPGNGLLPPMGSEVKVPHSAWSIPTVAIAGLSFIVTDTFTGVEEHPISLVTV
jgi:hypothetical protein